MKLILSLIAAFTLSVVSVSAREVPFDAVISSESAMVRSGPGDTDYYPTQKLERGTRIKVVRESYGGWYMIEPPPGSHSWIRAEFVDRRGDNKGIVRENTVDRLGSLIDRSQLTIIHKVVQGEIVTILGSATMRSGDRPVEMLKISPPRGEYRYINRRDVTPADDYSSARQPRLRGSAAADAPARSRMNDSLPDSPFPDSAVSRNSVSGPFGDAAATDSSSKPARNGENPGLGNEAFDLNTSVSDSGDGRASASEEEGNRLPDSARQGISMPGVGFEAPQPLASTPLSVEDRVEVEQAWQNVRQTDTRFRQMLKTPVSQWNLPSLKSAYQQSADRLTDPSLKRQVENRIAAVDRYQKIYADQIEIARILARTESRDEEIRQSYLARWHSVSTSNPPTTRILKPGVAGRNPASQQDSPVPDATRAVQRSAAGSASAAGSPTASGPQKFAGAGIVQRSALSRPGFPSFVLLAPDGRVLSYLQAAPGVDLARHIGQSRGITGARGFRPELNADLMIVRGLTPVNLQP